MRQPLDRFGAIMRYVPNVAMAILPFEPMWMSARAGSLRPGDTTPDFDLPAVDHTRRVRMSEECRSKPVVLIFGSYTRPPFRREVPELNSLYDNYKDRASFYIVYIKEAHPVDLWQMPSNERDHVLLYSPRTDADRFENAGQCVRKLGIRIPALIDGIDDRTELAYTGWPERLYVIAPGGRIVYKSAPGPFGFKPKTMETYLSKVWGEAPRSGLSAAR